MSVRVSWSSIPRVRQAGGSAGAAVVFRTLGQSRPSGKKRVYRNRSIVEFIDYNLGTGLPPTTYEVGLVEGIQLADGDSSAIVRPVFQWRTRPRRPSLEYLRRRIAEPEVSVGEIITLGDAYAVTVSYQVAYSERVFLTDADSSAFPGIEVALAFAATMGDTLVSAIVATAEQLLIETITLGDSYGEVTVGQRNAPLGESISLLDRFDCALAVGEWELEDDEEDGWTDIN